MPVKCLPHDARITTPNPTEQKRTATMSTEKFSVHHLSFNTNVCTVIQGIQSPSLSVSKFEMWLIIKTASYIYLNTTVLVHVQDSFSRLW